MKDNLVNGIYISFKNIKRTVIINHSTSYVTMANKKAVRVLITGCVDDNLVVSRDLIIRVTGRWDLVIEQSRLAVNA